MAASEKQMDLCTRLYAERQVPDEVRDLVLAKAEALTPKDFSEIIDILTNMPRKPVATIEADKLFLVDGKVYKTQRSQAGRVYAKVLRNGRFEYDSQAIRQIPSGTDEITIEQAIQFGWSTGTCCCCGRELSDEDSVAAGIGPVCSSRRFGLTPKQLRAKAASMREAVSA